MAFELIDPGSSCCWRTLVGHTFFVTSLFLGPWDDDFHGLPARSPQVALGGRHSFAFVVWFVWCGSWRSSESRSASASVLLGFRIRSERKIGTGFARNFLFPTFPQIMWRVTPPKINIIRTFSNDALEEYFPFQTGDGFRFHVNLPGCISFVFVFVLVVKNRMKRRIPSPLIGCFFGSQNPWAAWGDPYLSPMISWDGSGAR